MVKFKQRKLIMCVTPLQLVIAKKIIEKHQLKNVDVLITAHNNEKFKYYINLIEQVSENIYVLNTGTGSRLKTYYNYFKNYFYVKFYLKYYYHEVYLSSIDSIYFHMVLSKIKKGKIYTFDDGLVNIIKNSSYYIESEFSFKDKILRKLFGILYTKEIVRGESIKHYTIYDGVSNIIENKEYIKLIELNEINENTNTITIFVGQPIADPLYSKIPEIIKKLNVDYYFPHPRESEKFSGIDYINTVKIFEHYIIDFILEHKCKVKIYGFFSTVLINLKGIKNIEIISVFNSELMKKYYMQYDFLKSYQVVVEEI
ncbi:glycosyltransferase family 52 [Acinetobacter sp. SA01]|uniref:glycosyltransferase family 52 n=1 Tax=Acinetobacter sp. SA01 TaxID=1862567 RepID=UPI00140E4084